MTRAANKVAVRPRRESRTTGSTGTGRKIATWSVARRAFPLIWKRGRLEQDAARRSWRADPGASPALVRPSALPTPSRGGKGRIIRCETPEEGEGKRMK